MTLRKQLLHYMLDIGGVCTLNNLYSPTATTYENSLRHLRDLKSFWLKNEFIEPIIPYKEYRPDHPFNKTFYRITKMGCEFIGRPDEYKPKVKSTSIKNVEHDSKVYDWLISYLRKFPDWETEIDYPRGKVCPDARIKSKKNDRHYAFYLEVESKDTTDRPAQKIEKYEQLERGVGDVPKFYKVLIAYSHSRQYPSFHRPTQLTEDVRKKNEERTLAVANHQFPDNFLIASKSDFDRIDEAVWINNKKQRVKLIN